MTDRELLELAAKAAGIKFHSYVDSDLFGRGINVGEADVPLWNPLDDDGDALRLAVKLELEIYSGSSDGTPQQWVGWAFPNKRTRYLSEPHCDDALAATRRAIVRAAAELGKAA